MMTKYYRVRSQEQWDWLMEHLELEYPFSSTTFLTDSIFMDLKDDQQLVPKISIKSSNINKIIEVSKLMEDEKTEKEDYVVIRDDDLLKLKDENNDLIFMTHKDGSFDEIDGLRVPKPLVQQKVKMTQAEKDEFDELDKDIYTTLTGTLKYIEEKLENSLLHKRLFYNNDFRLDNKAQIEFARAWADPSLIEVIPEKRWNVKVPPFERTNKYYYKYGEELDWSISSHNEDEDQQFTESELKEYGLDDDMYEKVEVKE